MKVVIYNNAAQMHGTARSLIGLKNSSKGGKTPRGLTTGLTHTSKESLRNNKRYALRESPKKCITKSNPIKVKKNSLLV